VRALIVLWCITQFFLASAALAQSSPETVTLAKVKLVANVPSKDAQFVQDAVQAQLCKRKSAGACVERLVVKAFQRRGYVRASAKVQQITFANPARPQDFTAIVNVEPGKIYKLAKIEVTHNTVLSAAELSALPQPAQGKPLDAEEWENFVDAMENAYRRKGHSEFTFLPSMRLSDSEGTVVLSLDVIEEKH